MTSSKPPIAELSEALPAALAHVRALAGWTQPQRDALAARLELVHAPAGQVIVAQAAVDRSMYLCLAGSALVTRDSVLVQRVGRGDHFGELALLTGTVRAATVRAEADALLARLSYEQYEALQSSDPGLGRRFLEAMISSVAQRLSDMTSSVQHLLHERSLPRRAQLDVVIAGRARSVSTGTLAGSLLPAEIAGHAVVAALVNRRPASLASALSSNCTLEALTTAHWEGQRIYRKSLALLLLEAAHRVAPALVLHMDHSVGGGQRVRVECAGGMTLAELGPKLAAEMRALCGAGTALHEEWWTVDEALEYFRDRHWDEVVDLLRTSRDATVPLVSYGELYLPRQGPLVPDAGVLRGFDVRTDDDGLVLIHGDAPQSAAGAVLPPVEAEALAAEQARTVSRRTRELISGQQRWLQMLGIGSVGAFNRTCLDGNVTQLIRVNEGLHEKALGQLADTIAARKDTVKIVCVAGPSSSGKTTFIKRLRTQLQVNGINPVGLSLDDYYIDRERTPLDEHGEYDFEALQAIDLALLADHLDALLAGGTVTTARYDFRTGRSDPKGGPAIELGARDILMMEGIHGLNPAVLGRTAPERAFRVFIAPLAHLPFDRVTRMHASDLRLLRRIVRDRHGRATEAAKNILRWPSVRAGERKHIFPHQHRADAVFDSSLVYELSVLKVFAERYLMEVPHDSPAFTTAYRLLRLLDRIVTIYPDHVPPTSLLREFIGGSGFEY